MRLFHYIQLTPTNQNCVSVALSGEPLSQRVLVDYQNVFQCHSVGGLQILAQSEVYEKVT